MTKEARPMSFELFNSLATTLVAWYKPAETNETNRISAFGYQANALIQGAGATMMQSGGA